MRRIAASRRPARPPGRRGGGPRASVALRPSVERRRARPVPAMPAPVARTTAGQVAPLTRMQPGDEQEDGEDVGAERETDATLTHSSACPTTPPRGSKAAAARTARRGICPGRAQRAGRQRQGQRRDQADHAGAQRPRTAGAARAPGSAPPATTSAPGRRAEGAEDVAHASRAPRRGAACPVHVDDAAQEHPDRDQRQPTMSTWCGSSADRGSAGRLARRERRPVARGRRRGFGFRRASAGGHVRTRASTRPSASCPVHGWVKVS